MVDHDPLPGPAGPEPAAAVVPCTPGAALVGRVPSLPRWDLRRAPLRLLLSGAVGGLAVFLCPGHVAFYLRALVGWDAGALALVGLSWWIIARADAFETRCRAAANDPGRLLVWFLVVAASLFSLFASVYVLRRVRTFSQPQEALWTGLSLAAVALSWLLTHTAYTLRYAHLYYRHTKKGRGRVPGGLKFPDDCHPCDMDFAYYAFTIGMCFQVSDVSITSRSIRRATLLHALLSFVFNTTLLALAFNLASGLLG